ncbi:NAD(P)/FAD-dependent oxidoreductase [Maritalea mediterranea]|uniref:FAD-dependent oxidoreductase n=1 Tax=Maritalea mediterranea TaxID=2909667 RepID=A0ABS9EAB9_9HYPH|nr:FAD-dependent oxidoreductase [Maritalea mediterranea]MCF4099142.1 FAD-dependent oxidoreductase [Maritalea mediterranea]
MTKLNIAVIGSGISGLSAAWLLSKNHNVTLYEANDYLGGHSNTVDAPVPEGDIPVDTGFIVYNEPNYPNLSALFDHFNIATKRTDMSFSFTMNGGKYEYSGSGLNGFFGQRRNVANPMHWSQLSDILRFFKSARERIKTYDKEVSLGDFLALEGYDRPFIENHIIPMGAAIWSTKARSMMEYPAQTFINFYHNHALMKAYQKPNWRTVIGGSREYIKAMMADANIEVHSSTPIKKIMRHPGYVHIEDSNGVLRPFDHVVLASHADQSLAMLDDASSAEQNLLTNFPYQANTAVLHKDDAWMPKRKRLWSCWNYLKHTINGEDELCVTYWMNELQHLETKTNLFVTLNPTREIHPKAVIKSFDYMHPVFDIEAIEAQKGLWHLQGKNRTWFCGAYFGYGFHEDGIQSGLAVAEQLGGMKRPWQVENPSGRINVTPMVPREAAE